MKKILFFALMGTLMLGSFTSCNNKPQEPTQEEIDAQKQALADSVLTKIDTLATEFINISDSSLNIHGIELTKAEKNVKPDYLLAPSEESKFVTKSQKVNALAIYIIEMGVREIYGMPVGEAKEAIAKLAADINYPVDIEKHQSSTPVSELIREEYTKYKENGDLATFWQLQSAIHFEFVYLIAQNPDLFYSKITEEQHQAFNNWTIKMNSAIKELSQYDDEMSQLWKFMEENMIAVTPDDKKAKFGNLATGKNTCLSNRDKFIARRNALLQ